MFSFSALRTASFLVTPFMVLIYLAVNGCLQEQTAVLWKEPKHNLALESKDEGDLSKQTLLPGELKRAKCVITTIKSQSCNNQIQMAMLGHGTIKP